MSWGILQHSDAKLGLSKQHVELLEHPCMLHSFVPPHSRSYRELLRASCAGAGASFREADCTARYRTPVYIMTGGTTGAACPRHGGEGGLHILWWYLGPASCESTSTSFLQNLEANFVLLPAKPVMLVQYHRGRASLPSWNWKLNAVLRTATGNTELSLFKAFGFVSGPRESLNHRQWKQL